MDQGSGTKETAHRSVRLKLPPAPIIGPNLSLVSLDITAENLVIGVAVCVEQMHRLFVQREKVGVEQTMPGFMRERGSHSTFRHFALRRIERSGNYNCIDALLSESGIPQHAFGQVLILGVDGETLLNKTV